MALLIETSNGYCRGLLDGIIAYAKHHANWSIHLTEQERGAAPPAWLQSWKGDGIIARIETDTIGRRLRKFGLPIVDLSAARHVKGIPWADTDDEAISRLGVQHFTERGFTQLAYCGDPGFAWSSLRRDHFKQMTLAAGCSFHEHQMTPRYDPHFSWDAEKRAIASWLRQLPRPAAIMACYDFQAQQVLDVCRELEIAVPEEIAVLGVDDDRLICELAEPNLSSVIPDTKSTGYEAAELLDRMMQGEPVSPRQRLITQPLGIRVRQSTDTLAIEDVEVARALSYIRRHALANIRVTDILRHVSLSRRALEHRFMRLIGHTPHEEIMRVRVDRIKVLLNETSLSVHEIAERAGFEYAEYMAAVFKRETGTTPTEFRAKCQT
ncbi:xylose operon regulatory protein [Rhodopirellula maiorica SM1]|uniref:Xylose operon regulatory protein n=1 Tax=Rhodopirellula maiorica SM1 TaxID=1265738 RepID=M5R9F7_9BACT|nr:xylose operon regulatory protein [Rhodopirellula maiorica SM1]